MDLSSIRATSTGPNVKLTFKYLHQTASNKVEFEEVVAANKHVPSFHIHQEIPFGSDCKYVFRYWKLTSGNVSSKMTVLSDCTFEAVYDKVSVSHPVSTEAVVSRVEATTDTRERGSAWQMAIDSDGKKCSFLEGGSNKDGIPYCTYGGIGPKTNGYPFNKGIGCPYVKLLRQINGIAGSQDFTDKPNDFEAMTLL